MTMICRSECSRLDDELFSVQDDPSATKNTEKKFCTQQLDDSSTGDTGTSVSS
jgi:hypothetical protein